MKKTLIEHATVLTMDEERRVLQDGYVLTEGTRIAAVGEGAYSGECDARVDARGGILLPGFVNTHAHASMVPFRTMGDDCPDRLRRFLFPLENEAMTRELVYWGAMFGICEMLLSGITTFVDMYYFEEEVGRACEELGIQGYLGESVIGQPTCDSPEPYGGFEIAGQMFDRFADSRWVHPIVAVHGTTTCSPEALCQAHEMAVRHDTLLTLHACEMDYEMEHFARQGETPVSFMQRIGLVDRHLLAAHCIHMNQQDIAILREGGASVAHCIGSNTKAGKGVAPVAQLARAGVPYGLGTDGPSSGNTLSMFDQMRLFATFHKTVNHDRSLFPAVQIVSAATRGGARALGAQGEFGQIVPGMRADLVVVSTQAAHLFPVYNPYSALVYGANSSDVDLVMTAGEIRVHGGRVLGADLERIRAKLTEHMAPFMQSAAKYADII